MAEEILKIGTNVVIRTVTFHYIGRIADISDVSLTLEDASWLAWSGKWSEFLQEGLSSGAEVEPFPDPVVLNRESFIDMTLWRHGMIREAV